MLNTEQDTGLIRHYQNTPPIRFRDTMKDKLTSVTACKHIKVYLLSFIIDQSVPLWANSLLTFHLNEYTERSYERFIAIGCILYLESVSV